MGFKNVESYVDFNFVEVVSKKLLKISRLFVYNVQYLTVSYEQYLSINLCLIVYEIPKKY